MFARPSGTRSPGPPPERPGPSWLWAVALAIVLLAGCRHDFVVRGTAARSKVEHTPPEAAGVVARAGGGGSVDARWLGRRVMVVDSSGVSDRAHDQYGSRMALIDATLLELGRQPILVPGRSCAAGCQGRAADDVQRLQAQGEGAGADLVLQLVRWPSAGSAGGNLLARYLDVRSGEVLGTVEGAVTGGTARVVRTGGIGPDQFRAACRAQNGQLGAGGGVCTVKTPSTGTMLTTVGGMIAGLGLIALTSADDATVPVLGLVGGAALAGIGGLLLSRDFEEAKRTVPASFGDRVRSADRQGNKQEGQMGGLDVPLLVRVLLQPLADAPAQTPAPSPPKKSRR